MTTVWVYGFDQAAEPDKYVLGGKGANLAEMTRVGLPVPPGFTIPTSACHAYQKVNQLTEEMKQQVIDAIARVEETVGRKFGGNPPLLVSVRSGAPISMPGMMDTVLNLGLNDHTVEALAEEMGNRRFALDCHRRFIQMFGDVVLGIHSIRFEQILDDVKSIAGVKTDQELTADDLAQVISRYKVLVERETGEAFPEDPFTQLFMAIGAVFSSWDNPRAKVYRKVHEIPDSLGTAVNVQTMVFGNLGDDSGTGVAFTRNPSTGARGVFGEYLINAQGEDVVAGIRTPQPIAHLRDEMPEVYHQFIELCNTLEQHYKDVQDIEFTIQQGHLYLLQTRTAKRTAEAAVKIAVALVEEGVIDRATAVSRVDPDQLDQLLHPRLDPNAKVQVIATGLPASPGAASGVITFTADDAETRAQSGERVLLVRAETTPEDIHGILAAEGILTSRGGMTSHAAVVARGMGKPCICGCDSLQIDTVSKMLRVGETVLREGDLLSIDGGTGRVIVGDVPLTQPELSEELNQLLDWADGIRRLGVRANADTPEDALKSRQFGAGGVGLCRTEHMFMAADRVPVVQQMILAETPIDRQDALDQLLPMQQGDFYGILQAMDGLPVTIRLLDPPLHEFLPNLEKLIAREAMLRERSAWDLDNEETQSDLSAATQMLRRVRELHEQNPMLGHRGCRLGLTHPEVYEMQVRAIFQATAELQQHGYTPKPEIMIPLVGHVEELHRMRKMVEEVRQAVEGETGFSINCPVGTMIEVPRAALTAAEIAKEAEFFSFGTNDLTQTTFGYSRDDAEGKFLHQYVDGGILPQNPFQVLDADGVGQLVAMGTEGGRRTRPNLKVGICGEHGGEKRSIAFCDETGLDYVSCSPFRVPLARLAAAQAALKQAQSRTNSVASVTH
ncbi:pyruvate, phosphate dikinase [Alicyclobacillus ferrooxydans]|uniref:Pyruvate, phosphate dikinase n=1 Tax=Alicyclobacillus ferrooxydans TaxID=471514 RepID=A0A0P9C1Z1_9BACL|nr:pyruvate, phosphate dikinase [Alicyclobacillus ferrooxydans]KPV38955.1 pyruvate phosphate dikinase [Alicyclobacillus ferrooxydans]